MQLKNNRIPHNENRKLVGTCYHYYQSRLELVFNEYIIYSYTCLPIARPPLPSYNSFDCHLEANTIKEEKKDLSK